MDAAALSRRISWETSHPPVYHVGVSEARLKALRTTVRDLETADPGRFEFPPAGDPGARRTVRYLSALVPDDVPDEQLHYYVADIIGNPHLPPEQVREILVGGLEQHGSQIEATTLRAIGRLLREGRTQREVSTALGVSRPIVTELANFLGVTEARIHYLRDQAMDALEDGTEAQEFAEQHGLGVKTATDLLKDVEEALL